MKGKTLLAPWANIACIYGIIKIKEEEWDRDKLHEREMKTSERVNERKQEKKTIKKMKMLLQFEYGGNWVLKMIARNKMRKIWKNAIKTLILHAMSIRSLSG